ncbi:MAG TPA: phosphate signaling complex protein PhoU [Acidimicrobiales bacterium]|nr:phosphate signaling complex protein PhoU [Acidimicrobiales bacterium]
MTEIRKAFHEELEEVSDAVMRLSALAAEAINAATDALLSGDLFGTEAVITGDRAIDDLAHEIEDRCFELLARQSPMAVDLRALMAALRIVHELERIGDNMVNIAKGARRLYPNELDPAIRGILDRMRDQALSQLRVATTAFGERDAVRASAVPDMDDVMDDLQRDLFRVVFATSADHEAALERAVGIALVGRYFERVADHAVNAAERVTFMVTGSFRGAPAAD